MAIQLADNFSYQGGKPLDARIQYATVAAMKAVADSALYEGCKAYCVETEKEYQWKSGNTVDPTTGKWRESTGGGGGDFEKMSQNDVDDIKGAVNITPRVEPFEKMTDSDVADIKDAFQIYRPFAGLTMGIGGGYAPLGTINFFDATVAPQDWLACDGSVYNIADYPQLAEWYATQHGASNFYGGNGTTTFAVPDLQGEFLRGTGTNSHTNQGSGANVGVHQDGTEIPAFSSSGGAFVGPRDNNINNKDSQFGSSIFAYIGVSNGGPDTTYYTSRPTNTSFLICVKAVVAGEVYSTEERVGGTWIDGKKWYYKTVDCGTMPNATSKFIPTGISNFDKLVDVYGVAINTSTGFCIPFPTPNPPDASGAIQIAIVLNNGVHSIRISSGKDQTSLNVSYVTLRYTKTTD